MGILDIVWLFMVTVNVVAWISAIVFTLTLLTGFAYGVIILATKQKQDIYTNENK